MTDEPAAEIVRKIYDLCLAGRGPTQIASQLKREGIMPPTEYYHSLDKKWAISFLIKPHLWKDSEPPQIVRTAQKSPSV